MEIDLNIEDARWEALGLEALAETAAEAVLARLVIDQNIVELSLLGCNDARIAELNAEFRGKPLPTNVLSWPAEERAAEIEGDMPEMPKADMFGTIELGDIAIAFETCAREAEAAGKTLEAHATHLLVHGVLHLLGFDHERDRDATLMEGLETEILGKMGIEDPYCQDK
ncbi:MAG TPA: rRNA maturation RNase YbeY [Paracoccaceae bacterium]|nr:rRNA maturation RNase YbeY [Paracoccaceae bacterium]